MEIKKDVLAEDRSWTITGTFHKFHNFKIPIIIVQVKYKL